MNYGYDASGNRVHGSGGEDDSDRESARVEAVVNGGATTARTAAVHATAATPSGSDTDSAFSDDVELVIGETGNQPISEPLAERIDMRARGRHRAETEAYLQLEAGPAASTAAAGGPRLLIGDRAAPSAGGRASFLSAVASVPSRVRTVALLGSLHQGKSDLLKMLLDDRSYAPRQEEVDRRMSLEAHVVSALVRGAKLHKSSNLVTFIDTPGHGDFIGEAVAALRLADAVLFCVDALESLDAHAERLLRHTVLTEQLPIVLVITKMDRLMLDLKLPPLDAYRKLRLIVEAVNNVIASCGADRGEGGQGGVTHRYLVAPENGTVLFTSAKLGFVFSLETFALKYAEAQAGGGGAGLDSTRLAQRLWGQVTFERGAFVRIANFRQRPSFVTFVLEPLYKIVAHAVTGKGAVVLSEQLAKLPRSPLDAVREAVRLFLGSPGAEGADALLAVLPSAHPRAVSLSRAYGLLRDHDNAAQGSEAAEGQVMFTLPSDSAGTSVARGPADPSTDGVEVAAVAPLVRVFTGTAQVSGGGGPERIRKHHRTAMVVRVLKGVLRGRPTLAPSAAAAPPPRSPLIAIDELSDELNPFSTARVGGLFLRLSGEGFVEVDVGHPGQVLYMTLEEEGEGGHGVGGGAAAAAAGVHTSKHAVFLGGRAARALLTVAGSGADEEALAYAAVVEDWLAPVRPRPLHFGHAPMVHVSLELKDPAGLSTFQRGLNLLRRTSPGLDLRTEESGEFTMTGFGELHLDTALHQLRTEMCPGLRMGLSQPFVSFTETVMDEEGAVAVAGSRRKGTVGCTSGALPRSLVTAMAYEQLDFTPTWTTGAGRDEARVVRLWTALRRDHGFDALDARHVLALGPDRTKGPSLLIDDTLVEGEPDTVGMEAVPGVLQPPLTRAQREAVVAGFRDAMRVGPLVGETVRGVGVRLVWAEPGSDRSVRANEVRSTARLAVRQSLYGARPRLLEPILSADILCTPECAEKISAILQQRRGAVLGEEPIAATTLSRVRALVPAMDSFGLETQIRMQTGGQAFPMFQFSQWDVVPGDPYDATVHVGPMEPARGYELARDFVLKTRFRKGLPMELTGDM